MDLLIYSNKGLTVTVLSAPNAQDSLQHPPDAQRNTPTSCVGLVSHHCTFKDIIALFAQMVSLNGKGMSTGAAAADAMVLRASAKSVMVCITIVLLYAATTHQAS